MTCASTPEAGMMTGSNTNSRSKRPLRWLVFGASTYWLYAFVASILAALTASLI
jgi:fumarate reductase subunit D